MEKGEIAQNDHFHLFPQCFPKAFYLNVLKLVYMEERVKCLWCKSKFHKTFFTVKSCRNMMITFSLKVQFLSHFSVNTLTKISLVLMT